MTLSTRVVVPSTPWSRTTGNGKANSAGIVVAAGPPWPRSQRANIDRPHRRDDHEEGDGHEPEPGHARRDAIGLDDEYLVPGLRQEVGRGRPQIPRPIIATSTCRPPTSSAWHGGVVEATQNETRSGRVASPSPFVDWIIETAYPPSPLPNWSALG